MEETSFQWRGRHPPVRFEPVTRCMITILRVPRVLPLKYARHRQEESQAYRQIDSNGRAVKEPALVFPWLHCLEKQSSILGQSQAFVVSSHVLRYPKNCSPQPPSRPLSSCFVPISERCMFIPSTANNTGWPRVGGEIQGSRKLQIVCKRVFFGQNFLPNKFQNVHPNPPRKCRSPRICTTLKCQTPNFKIIK